MKSTRTWVMILLLGSGSWITAQKPSAHNPDFTKGEAIPKGADHDWTLGATGLRGWIFSDKLVTTDARQIMVTKVAKDSPAAGLVEVGDVILGANGNLFRFDPRIELGRALSLAESRAGRGRLDLIRWRKGREKTARLKVPILGDYSPTAPYDCQKSARILKQGCAALAERMRAPDYKLNPIPRCLNALALLASGDRQYRSLIKREAEWAASFTTGHFHTWYYGYALMLLGEYIMVTGDRSVFAGMERLAMEAADGQSDVGSWGHRFARPNGRLRGYGMMNSPGIPLTIGLVMARKAGLESPKLDRAIRRGARLIRFYVGKGAIPYGDHHPWIEAHEGNGKCGMAAVLFNLLGDAQAAEFFSRMSLASHGSERDTGHTGNYFNLLWAMPGIALSGQQATGGWMQEFGAPYLDLARQWDGNFTHQGPPQKKWDSYRLWDSTGVFLLAYAMPKRALILTGRESSNVPQLDVDSAASVLGGGRGWSNKDRFSFHDNLSTDELLARLQSWSPVSRERAALAIGRRDRKTKIKILEKILELMGGESVQGRLGACQATAHLGAVGKDAVPTLIQMLDDEDLWVRVKAADALARIGKPAHTAIPALLKRVVQPLAENDPRGMEQRFLCFALFSQRRGLLRKSIDQVDQDALRAAISAALSNEDGRARGAVASVYRSLSLDQIKPLLPAIRDAISESAPSGIMFAEDIRVEGLELLARHRIKEGIEACASYIATQKRHGSTKRTRRVMKILLSYGSHAQAAIPTLEMAAATFERGEEFHPRKNSLEKAKVVRDAITAIRAETSQPKLITID